MITTKKLIPEKQAEAVQTTQYTAVNCKTLVDKFTVTNTTGAPVVISINLVPPLGVLGAANRIVSLKSIAPNECYSCPEMVGQGMEAGGIISTLAGAANSLTISATGREIT